MWFADSDNGPVAFERLSKVYPRFFIFYVILCCDSNLYSRTRPSISRECFGLATPVKTGLHGGLVSAGSLNELLPHKSNFCKQPERAASWHLLTHGWHWLYGLRYYQVVCLSQYSCIQLLATFSGLLGRYMTGPWQFARATVSEKAILSTTVTNVYHQSFLIYLSPFAPILRFPWVGRIFVDMRWPNLCPHLTGQYNV